MMYIYHYVLYSVLYKGRSSIERPRTVPLTKLLTPP